MKKSSAGALEGRPVLKRKKDLLCEDICGRKQGQLLSLNNRGCRYIRIVLLRKTGKVFSEV